ncbi:MAG: 23S rRNA (adenine(2503)-C(2))-methyltransferase RlmN [Phycisphaeraceae bacterium]
MPEPATCFFDHDPAELATLFGGWGLPRYRAEQVRGWVYDKGVTDPHAMSNLPHRDRELLAERMRFTVGQIVREQQASDGTRKLLLAWPEAAAAGNAAGDASQDARTTLPVLGERDDDDLPWHTECVMIPAGDRRTACISSQVGCPVGCKFCASGLGGLEGNLSAGRIVEQVWWLNQHGGRITNVVFMGMGEPLANFAAVTRAVRTLAADWAFNLSARRITVSTVGLPAQIRRLADLELPITLAVSLHAPNDELRRTLIPWADRVSVDQLIDAGRYYFHRTGREVTLEYILLGGVNDQAQHARELARVARRLRSNINLIRYNEVAGLPFNRPRGDDVRAFQRVLREAGVNAHIRASRGRDIAAACGQLRHETRAAR